MVRAASAGSLGPRGTSACVSHRLGESRRQHNAEERVLADTYDTAVSAFPQTADPLLDGLRQTWTCKMAARIRLQSTIYGDRRVSPFSHCRHWNLCRWMRSSLVGGLNDLLPPILLKNGN